MKHGEIQKKLNAIFYLFNSQLEAIQECQKNISNLLIGDEANGK